MNNKSFEEIIFKLKNAIDNTEFENNLYILGGYLRDLHYGLIPNDLDLAIITNSDNNIFLNLIVDTFNLNIIDIKKLNANNFTFLIDNVRIDLKFLNNSQKIDSYKILKSYIINEFDYTINGLIKNVSTGKILEVSENVINDLKNKKINTFDETNFIFKKTPNSIFRLIRFYYTYNLRISKSILKYIKRNPYLINFIDRDRLIYEYGRIQNKKNNSKIIKLLNILNINPTDINRSPIFFGEGWHELEPGNIPNRVLDGKKYRWSKSNPEIFVSKNAEILKINIIKHPCVKSNVLKYYYDNDINNLYELVLKNDYNEILFNTNNIKKINIIVDTFIPSEFENVNDNRKLGIYLIDCKIYMNDINKNISVEDIPYLLEHN